MRNKAFDSIFKELSFLDEYEREYTSNIKRTVNKKNENSINNTNSTSNSTVFKNNYKEEEKEIHPLELQKKEQEKSREKFSKSKYGQFVNREIDYNRIDDLDYLYSNLEVNRDLSLEESFEVGDRNAVKDATEKIKQFEYRYFAYLNKEFNILNKKMLKCSIVCYQDSKRFTTNEAKLCAETCHNNVKEAANFVENLQDKTREKLQTCIEKAKDFNTQTKDEDKVANFLNCYDDLIEDFTKMEIEIGKEFSNYI